MRWARPPHPIPPPPHPAAAATTTRREHDPIARTIFHAHDPIARWAAPTPRRARTTCAMLAHLTTPPHAHDPT
eukprot:4563169-Prymnesium_polylepis.1